MDEYQKARDAAAKEWSSTVDGQVDFNNGADWGRAWDADLFTQCRTFVRAISIDDYAPVYLREMAQQLAEYIDAEHAKGAE